MRPNRRFIHRTLAVVVLAGSLLTTSTFTDTADARITHQDLKTWCEAHGGTLFDHGSGMRSHCRLKNRDGSPGAVIVCDWGIVAICTVLQPSRVDDPGPTSGDGPIVDPTVIDDLEVAGSDSDGTTVGAAVG